MRTQYFLQSGLVVKKSNDVEDRFGLFSLGKWFKKMLTALHVAYTDDCCTIGTQDNLVTDLPIFYNKTAGHFYYYDPTTQLPVQITGF